ncbi:MAG TPA: hypothetical protein VER98_08200 [Terriglobia bacterium]|nr:hypothetical protein [Terriglobia bacterium]
MSGTTLIAIPNPSTITAGKNVVQYSPPMDGTAKARCVSMLLLPSRSLQSPR